MLFKEVTQGTPLYLLDRSNITIGQCSVVSASQPHFDVKMIGNPPGMVVDVTIDVNGQKKAYVFPENADFGNAEGLMITPNRDVLIREVQGMMGQSEAALKMIDRHKEAIVKCRKILSELDPVAKDRADLESRISSLENTNKDLLSKMDTLIKTIQGGIKK